MKKLYEWKYLASPTVTVIPKKKGKRAVANLIQKLLQRRIHEATLSLNRVLNSALYPPVFETDPFNAIMERADAAKVDGVVTRFVEIVGDDGRVWGSWGERS